MTGRYLLGGISAVVLAVTLAMHLAALVGGSLPLPPALGLALLAAEFVLLGAFVVSAARHFLRERPTAAGLRDLFPGWVLPLVLVVSVYSFGSFLLHFAGTAGERLVVDGDRYLLMHGSEVAAELDEADYRARLSARTRAETAYSLVFLLVPCLWFLCRRDSRGRP